MIVDSLYLKLIEYIIINWMIDPETISCMMVDVIRITLDTCHWEKCGDECLQYLWNVAWDCPIVFNDLTYKTLWETLITLCSPGD